MKTQCKHCERHIKAGDTTCPFCYTSLAATILKIRHVQDFSTVECDRLGYLVVFPDSEPLVVRLNGLREGEALRRDSVLYVKHNGVFLKSVDGITWGRV